jgi:hypothetical protein
MRGQARARLHLLTHPLLQPVIAKRAAQHRCSTASIACDYMPVRFCDARCVTGDARADACSPRLQFGCKHRGTHAELHAHEAEEAASHAALLRIALRAVSDAQVIAHEAVAQAAAAGEAAAAAQRESAADAAAQTARAAADAGADVAALRDELAALRADHAAALAAAQADCDVLTADARRLQRAAAEDAAAARAIAAVAAPAEALEALQRQLDAATTEWAEDIRSLAAGNGGAASIAAAATSLAQDAAVDAAAARREAHAQLSALFASADENHAEASRRSAELHAHVSDTAALLFARMDALACEQARLDARMSEAAAAQRAGASLRVALHAPPPPRMRAWPDDARG